MDGRLTSWGNSAAIRIPKSIIQQLNWEIGEDIELFVKDNALVIQERRKYDLASLLSGMTEENYGDHAVADDCEPVGNELL